MVAAGTSALSAGIREQQQMQNVTSHPPPHHMMMPPQFIGPLPQPVPSYHQQQQYYGPPGHGMPPFQGTPGYMPPQMPQQQQQQQWHHHHQQPFNIAHQPHFDSIGTDPSAPQFGSEPTSQPIPYHVDMHQTNKTQSEPKQKD